MKAELTLLEAHVVPCEAMKEVRLGEHCMMEVTQKVVWCFGYSFCVGLLAEHCIFITF